MDRDLPRALADLSLPQLLAARTATIAGIGALTAAMKAGAQATVALMVDEGDVVLIVTPQSEGA